MKAAGSLDGGASCDGPLSGAPPPLPPPAPLGEAAVGFFNAGPRPARDTAWARAWWAQITLTFILGCVVVSNQNSSYDALSTPSALAVRAALVALAVARLAGVFGARVAASASGRFFRVAYAVMLTRCALPLPDRPTARATPPRAGGATWVTSAQRRRS